MLLVSYLLIQLLFFAKNLLKKSRGTTSISNKTKFLMELPKPEDAPWSGFTDSNDIWFVTTRGNCYNFVLRPAMWTTETRKH